MPFKIKYCPAVVDLLFSLSIWQNLVHGLKNKNKYNVKSYEKITTLYIYIYIIYICYH